MACIGESVIGFLVPRSHSAGRSTALRPARLAGRIRIILTIAGMPVNRFGGQLTLNGCKAPLPLGRGENAGEPLSPGRHEMLLIGSNGQIGSGGH